MRRTLCLLVTLLSIAMAAVGGRADEGDAAAHDLARRFVRLLDAGAFGEARTLCDEGMRKALPPGRMEGIWAELERDAGAFESLGEARVQRGGGYVVVDIACTFAKKILVLRVALDAEDRVAGFFKRGERPRTDEPGAIVLDTGSGVLRGTLDLPPGPGPFAVVILVAGSGPTDRDGNQPPRLRTDALRLLGRALVDTGVAVLRFDKRGVGQSAEAGPDEARLTLDGYVEDLVRWAKAMRADARFGPVLLAGHSEGALVATLGARQIDVEGLILLAGPGRRIGEVLRAQLTPQLTPVLRAENERILTALEGGERVDDVPEDLRAVYRPSVQPFLISLLRRDPASLLAEVDVPTLVVQGTTDVQVTVEDARRLAAAREGLEPVLIAGMNHVLKQARTQAEQQRTYTTPDLPLHPDLVPALTRFLAAALAAAPNAGSAAPR